MPTVFVWKGLQFFFYSNEREEPPHVHVKGGGAETKIWLSNLSVARNRGFADRQLRAIVELVDDRRQELLEAWTTHLGR